jgi:hypothetical protein
MAHSCTIIVTHRGANGFSHASAYVDHSFAISGAVRDADACTHLCAYVCPVTLADKFTDTKAYDCVVGSDWWPHPASNWRSHKRPHDVTVWAADDRTDYRADTSHNQSDDLPDAAAYVIRQARPDTSSKRRTDTRAHEVLIIWNHRNTGIRADA